jgi:hypothetical protein
MFQTIYSILKFLQFENLKRWLRKSILSQIWSWGRQVFCLLTSNPYHWFCLEICGELFLKSRVRTTQHFEGIFMFASQLPKPLVIRKIWVKSALGVQSIWFSSSACKQKDYNCWTYVTFCQPWQHDRKKLFFWVTFFFLCPFFSHRNIDSILFFYILFY